MPDKTPEQMDLPDLFCGALEPGEKLSAAYFDRNNAAFYSDTKQGRCTKPKGHKGRHGYKTIEPSSIPGLVFEGETSWPGKTDAG